MNTIGFVCVCNARTNGNICYYSTHGMFCADVPLGVLNVQEGGKEGREVGLILEYWELPSVSIVTCLILVNFVSKKEGGKSENMR